MHENFIKKMLANKVIEPRIDPMLDFDEDIVWRIRWYISA
jgi:hypothetical protein